MAGGEVLWVCALSVTSHPLDQFGSSSCIAGSKAEEEEEGVWRRKTKSLHLPEASSVAAGCS